MTVTLEKNVEDFIATPHKLFINGQWTEAASGRMFETPNPATGETLARIAEGDTQDIERAVRAARKAFDDGPWGKMTPSERGRLVWKIGDLIYEHLDELAQLESLDNGKPYAVAKVADVPLAADMFHYMAGWATKIEGNTISISVPYMPGANFHAYTLREPVGVVEHDVRALAAQLKTDLLEVPGRRGHDELAHLGGPGERHLVHVRVGGEGGAGRLAEA